MAVCVCERARAREAARLFVCLVDVYLHYFGKEDETKYGVVSFELEIIN